MEKLKKDNFEFNGKIFNVKEEVLVLYRSLGSPNGVKKYIGVIECVIECKHRNSIETYIKLDSFKHLLELKYIKKIETVTEENRMLSNGEKILLDENCKIKFTKI